VGEPIESVTIARDSSLRVSAVRVRLASGRVASVSGEQVTNALGLRSTWFSVGQLSVSTSARRVVYGGSVRVISRALDVKDAVLQEESRTGAWRTLQHVTGKSVLSVEPGASTAFRLRIAGATSSAADVAVRPQLRARPLGRRLLGGQLLPHTAGPVEVWRQVRGVWRVVARPLVRPDGTFRTPFRFRPTVYRVTAGDGAFAPVERRLVITRRMLAAMSH
jgi:hypothetical protein